jgi:hypothetical protein
MNLKVEGDYIVDSGKKVGVINGNDIYTLPDKKKIGKKNGSDLYNASGTRVGSVSNENIVKLFL